MFASSLGKKYLMALSGIVLVGFVFVHMAGNLQFLWGRRKSMPTPMPCSHYLYHTMGFPLILLLAVVVHAVTAYQLVKENRAARPNRNDIEKPSVLVLHL